MKRPSKWGCMHPMTASLALISPARVSTPVALPLVTAILVTSELTRTSPPWASMQRMTAFVKAEPPPRGSDVPHFSSIPMRIKVNRAVPGFSGWAS
ncbi:hypothetical protein BJX66DRAFT_318904 [Aspergillus keveii]|uniref:Secreted protein n=1 Tax=Aspergillus keveii TaxID=714993 RepID=A0ABR4FJ40_9EURO